MKKLLFLTLLLSAIGMKGWAVQYPNVLYAVGGAISTGWGAPNPATGSPLYKYSATVNETSHTMYQGFVKFSGNENDELKFMCQDNNWTDHWGAEGTVISNGDNQYDIYYYTSGDNKFKLGSNNPSGVYLVTIDATSKTVTFKLWDNSNDVYEIGNAAQLHAFANCVNNFCTTMKGKLTADINMTNEGWTPIGGEGHKYCGTFDGQGHMIDHLVLDNSGYDSQGIFGQVGGSDKADECIIMNLIAGPNNSIKGKNWVGGLIGCADGNGTIKLINCGQEGYVEADSVNAAAMIGCMKSCALYLENCYNIGNIKGRSESAIISGWLAGHKKHTVSGFYNTGSIEGQEGDCSLFRNKDGSNNWVDIPYSAFTKYENVYHIYAHQGATQVTKDADDYYQIGDGQKLKWFAYWTRTGSNTTAKGKLTANIDMSGIEYPGIGSDSKKFAGELKGDGSKIISNLTMDIDGDNVGLIGVANGDADVEDITLDFTCSFKGQSNVAAFIGKLDGDGSATLKQCGNEAPVTATVANAAGLVGYATSNDAAPEFLNCYNVGNIKSATTATAAGLSVHTEYAKFKNCYNYLDASKCSGLKIGTGEYDGKYWSFALGEHMTINDGDYTNNWDNLTWWISNMTLTDMADGTLKTSLGAAYTNMVYGANAHPAFVPQSSIVLSEGMLNTLPAENMAGMNVKLYRTLVAGSWNSICLPFDLDATGISSVFGAGTKVAAFTSATGTNLHFDLVTKMSAKTPYLIDPHDNRDINTPIELSGITIQVGPQTVSHSPFKFTGIYTPTAIDGKYFIASGNTIMKSNGGTLKGFRAYIEDTTPNAARILTLDFSDGETTEITTTDFIEFTEKGVWNTLDGRKLDKKPTSKGLYIVNGKKVVVK